MDHADARPSQPGARLGAGALRHRLSSVVELSQAQLNKTSAEIAAAGARYDYQTHRAILDRQTGRLR